MKTQKHGQSSLSDFGLYFLSLFFFFFNIDCSGGEEIGDWVSFLAADHFSLDWTWWMVDLN
jgi:hypothetical protein